MLETLLWPYSVFWRRYIMFLQPIFNPTFRYLSKSSFLCSITNKPLRTHYWRRGDLVLAQLFPVSDFTSGNLNNF